MRILLIFCGLAGVDGSSDLGESSKDSADAEKVLEKLPSQEASLDTSQSSRLTAPSSSVGPLPMP